MFPDTTNEIMRGKKNKALKKLCPLTFMLTNMAITSPIKIGKTTKKKRNKMLFLKEVMNRGSLKSLM